MRLELHTVHWHGLGPQDLGIHRRLDLGRFDSLWLFEFVDRSSSWDSGTRRSLGRRDRRLFDQRRKFRRIRRSCSWGTRRDPRSGERHSSSAGKSVGHWDRRQARTSGARRQPGSGRPEDRQSRGSLANRTRDLPGWVPWG